MICGNFRIAAILARALAVDYFVYRVGLNTGMLAAAMQGVDGFVFTAGIGENSPKIRAAIAAGLAWLGVSLDPEANANNLQTISRRDSRVRSTSCRPTKS